MSTYIPTGNEYIAVPTIRQADGAIESLNVILMQLDGLLEFAGPDGTPFITCPGMEAEQGNWNWSLRSDWIPVFQHAEDPSRTGFVLAPLGERFMVFRGPMTDTRPHFRVSLGNLYQTANIRHRIPRVDFTVSSFGWSCDLGVVVNVFCGPLVASLALRGSGTAKYAYVDGNGSREIAPHDFQVTTSDPFSIEIECEGQPELVLGVCLSSVGAMAANVEAGRISIDEWLARTETGLEQHRISIPGEEGLALKANRNGHFARFFAMGRTLDTDEVVSMTSRSYRYYVSSAYWDRDSLLWLYPFLLHNDKRLAEDLLRYAFGRQLQHAGIHSRYISGRILEYGFELDELAANLLAIGSWARTYPEDNIWEEEPFRKGIPDLLDRLARYRHDDVALYWTELMPTDDRTVEGRDTLTYNNALVAYALDHLFPILDAIAPERAKEVQHEVKAIRKAVKKYLVQDGMFLWASDMKGNTEFYDEAAGSLVLLPYYGFCDADDPVYQKTLQHLYSADYPYFKPGAFAELGNRHTQTPHPWILSACSSVLSGARVEEGLDFLRRAPMDNGIACESVNIDTGEPETGLHFGTCAGFVAHAIVTGAQG